MIQVQNLSKSFQNIQAVNDISFTIKKGEIFGFLGPNGAGKSTTLNMMSTILKSDAGTIHIDGKNSNENAKECKHLIGVVPQEISLYEDLSAHKNLLFWGNLYGIPSKTLKERIHTTLELIGLLDRKNDLIKTYSGGMKRRINIAAALLHNPKVLFMDEPTVGIDPQSRNHIFEVIETLNKQGMTIVYTTHYMEEVERLCDRIAIIDSGKIIAQGTQSQLKELVQTKESIQFEFNFLSESNVDQLRKLLSYTMTQNKNKLLVEITVKELSKVITACNELQLSIKDIQLNKVNLEAIFLNLTGKQLRD
ncbi:ABC-2 type transport system ATP-binding protein [Aquimarina sp. MAR_2010_214]|uniref:ABC transporter ATP-binding protein n=1 Tax=Aquimarina sp. MAR_2010_214 TaxID=1250026 RepID=UPI000C7128FB|nr:ABC transporter ATP-binding protein [Aquimarina sp. MAR_2010_214]PKV51380.1 ABC-2 type transport system ATP-binding protein [Aquimarina sp. MAR_2010_214]